MSNVYVGTVGKPLTFKVTPGKSGLDLSTVTAATIKVRKPNATEGVSWTGTVSYDAPTKTLKVTHVLAPGDVDVPGAYVAYAKLTHPGGVEDSPRRAFTVRTEYQLDS